MTSEIYIEPRDLWVGLYWDRRPNHRGVPRFNLWLCLLPCLVLHVEF